MATGFNKIGFHLAEGGDPTGIGSWMRQLNEARIPFFIKTADSMRGLDEAQEIVRQNRAAGIDVPHVSVFRRSGQLDADSHFDIPRYHLPPEQAARDHWALHKPRFPPNLDPAITWVETINEVRKEVEWCDWLGKFAWHTAQLALADGYRYAAFGFSSGTPDVTEGAWETDGMLQYLELCAEHPDRLSVALHEYSYSVGDIWRLAGFLVGGFVWLFRAADKHGIPRPKVLFTEWGWEHEKVPEPAEALRHIEEVGALYARYPEVLGAAIWYLGGGYNNIAHKAQRLIAPVTAFTLQHRYQLGSDAQKVLLPGEAADEGSWPAGHAVLGPTQPFAASMRAHVTPAAITVSAGKPFRVIWRVRNDGQRPWVTDAPLRQVEGVALAGAGASTPALAPGGEGDVELALNAPTAAGSYDLAWRLTRPDGASFGDRLPLRLTVPAAAAGAPESRFLADVTIPDGAPIVAGSQFVKIWRVQNVGEPIWGAGTQLIHVGGNLMAPALPHPVPIAQPGEIVELSVSLTAPDAAGEHRSDWRLADEQGHPFGDGLFALIRVQPAVRDARFVSDVTVPDGTRLAPGQAVRKTWRVENTGNASWSGDVRLRFVAGTAMTTAVDLPAPLTLPGARADLTVELTAPAQAGRHQGRWRLVDAGGQPFGEELFVLIEVAAGG